MSHHLESSLCGAFDDLGFSVKLMARPPAQREASRHAAAHCHSIAEDIEAVPVQQHSTAHPCPTTRSFARSPMRLALVCPGWLLSRHALEGQSSGPNLLAGPLWVSGRVLAPCGPQLLAGTPGLSFMRPRTYAASAALAVSTKQGCCTTMVARAMAGCDLLHASTSVPGWHRSKQNTSTQHAQLTTPSAVAIRALLRATSATGRKPLHTQMCSAAV
jgi:hypothetical protein